jgi:amidohydrolase
MEVDMSPKDKARQALESEADSVIELSRQLHANPELGFEEVKASAWVAGLLESRGWAVQRGAAGLPTALVAEAGPGSLCIGICAEYDALPDIGHACGHNVIAAAAVGAALALAAVADDLGLRVRLLGTPAEENGGGKIIMLEHGCFDGVHAAMMVHPGAEDRAVASTLAISEFDVEYLGREAHASSHPEDGTNAADALTVAQVAIGLLRQHIRPDERVHGITLKAGGAPNVIPGFASARYDVRAPTLERVEELEKRVRACFAAGALATGCSHEIRVVSPPYSHFEPDLEISSLYRENAEALGRTFAPDQDPTRRVGSTDMANVSLVVPTIHPSISVGAAEGIWNHNPAFAAQCATAAADQAAIDGGLAMAWTAIDLATSPELRQRLLSPAASAAPG